MVDDATGHTTAMLSEEETSEAAMGLFWVHPVKAYFVS